MRVMVLVKASKDCESGKPPDPALCAEMTSFNEELLKAGVLLAVEGLRPSSHGVRVRFGGGHSTVIDGPFSESKELVGGFWLWQVKSLAEAIEWLRRSPFRRVDREVEIRPVMETEDFADSLTPEIRVQEESQRARLSRRN